ncbi:unnamed protein product [Arctogadus glacialis]
MPHSLPPYTFPEFLSWSPFVLPERGDGGPGAQPDRPGDMTQRQREERSLLEQAREEPTIEIEEERTTRREQTTIAPARDGTEKEDRTPHRRSRGDEAEADDRSKKTRSTETRTRCEETARPQREDDRDRRSARGDDPLPRPLEQMNLEPNSQSL